MMLPQNRKAIPQVDIVCGTFKTEFKLPTLQCQNCTYVTIQLVPKCHCITWLNMHHQLNFNVNNALNNWWSLIGQRQHTCSVFRDCYINSITIENRHDLNDTDVPTEKSRIESQTKHRRNVKRTCRRTKIS